MLKFGRRRRSCVVDVQLSSNACLFKAYPGTFYQVHMGVWGVICRLDYVGGRGISTSNPNFVLYSQVINRLRICEKNENLACKIPGFPKQ